MLVPLVGLACSTWPVVFLQDPLESPCTELVHLPKKADSEVINAAPAMGFQHPFSLRLECKANIWTSSLASPHWLCNSRSFFTIVARACPSFVDHFSKIWLGLFVASVFIFVVFPTQTCPLHSVLFIIDGVACPFAHNWCPCLRALFQQQSSDRYFCFLMGTNYQLLNGGSHHTLLLLVCTLDNTKTSL